MRVVPKLFSLLLLTSLSLFLLGCTEPQTYNQPYAQPYTEAQFYLKNTDLNFTQVKASVFTGKVLGFNGNTLTALDTNFNDSNITGSGNSRDLAFWTSTKNLSHDGNFYYDSINDVLHTNNIVDVFDVNAKRLFQNGQQVLTSYTDTNTQTVGWTTDKPVFITDVNFNGNVYIKGNITADGNMSIKRPYGVFSSTKTQSIINANNAYDVDLNTTEDAYLMRVENSATDSNIVVDVSGDYKFDISLLFNLKAAPANKHAFVWLEKLSGSGAWVQVPRSNTQIEFPLANVETVVAVPFIIDLNAGGKVRFRWGGDSTNVEMLYVPSAINPSRPEVPSAIIVGNKISEISH